MFKIPFNDSAVRDNTKQRDVLDLNVGKFRLKMVNSQMIPPQESQGEIKRKFAKFSTKTDVVPFQKSLLRLISLMERARQFYEGTRKFGGS
jgi:hypothetical protein